SGRPASEVEPRRAKLPAGIGATERDRANVINFPHDGRSGGPAVTTCEVVPPQYLVAKPVGYTHESHSLLVVRPRIPRTLARSAGAVLVPEFTLSVTAITRPIQT